jgi:hypothetical protein
MKDASLGMLKEIWRKEPTQTSVMTSLGLIGGEVLLYLETCGAASARQLVRTLEWPVDMVYMAIGALIRQGLIQVSQNKDEIFVEPTTQLV